MEFWVCYFWGYLLYLVVLVVVFVVVVGVSIFREIVIDGEVFFLWFF